MKYFENPAWVGSVTIHSAYLKYFKNHVYVVLNTCRFECSIQSSNSWSVTSVLKKYWFKLIIRFVTCFITKFTSKLKSKKVQRQIIRVYRLIGSRYSFESCGIMFESRLPDQDSQLSVFRVKIALSLFLLKKNWIQSFTAQRELEKKILRQQR